MTTLNSTRSSREASSASGLDRDYFRLRDFEYVQPLYDLAFLLEVAALASGTEVPKYRTFSLWRAGYSLDGYGTMIDKWLDAEASDGDLDYIPSSRILQYLTSVRTTGTLPELRQFSRERYVRALRLRSVRGLGPSKIAATLTSTGPVEDWLEEIAIDIALDKDRIAQLYSAANPGPWQTAHVVPPLLRLLRTVEESGERPLGWHCHGVADPFEPITRPLKVCVNLSAEHFLPLLKRTLRKTKHFRADRSDGVVRHQLGWVFSFDCACRDDSYRSIEDLAVSLDPLASPLPRGLRADLHLHTAWSDGAATVETMAKAVVANGLDYFAVTDHSRSSKLQNGLTPATWLRQANALSLAAPVCPVIHGIEVDILRDGALDLPASLLAKADLVVASVHSSWSDDPRENTDRLLRAIESGSIDVIAHPTSALVGKPGVPDYVRHPADVDWQEVFAACARCRVAVEFNCFPSRLDLPLALLREAVRQGCAISLGSDSHARSHLVNLRFGAAALQRVDADLVLNRLSPEDLRLWIRESRATRRSLAPAAPTFAQPSLDFEPDASPSVSRLTARPEPPHRIPHGSRVVGVDLTAGDKPTGLAVIDGYEVHTCSLKSDDEIFSYVTEQRPAFVSIDSPLGLPGGGETIDPTAGIVRVAEHDLASVGIPAYPALIDSMERLTLRGIQLRRHLESEGIRVIESYPGAAQDILCLPRKQKGLDLLRDGLRRLGLDGPGLDTCSHDEMDAITAAVVARYYERGSFEPMGIEAEAQLIIPKVSPLLFEQPPVVCLAGKTGAGKSVVARYLSIFYGFTWIRTRNVIRELLIESGRLGSSGLFRDVSPDKITEQDLREFGAIVLEKYQQAPLRRKLAETLSRLNVPVVVDSIRDTVDVERSALGTRPVLIWFVDASDTAIRDRLARRHKLGEKRINAPSPVDKTAVSIRNRSTHTIPNSGSLEELRWRIDDTLFDVTTVE
jgi:histidinol phosphatase-like PHP family hydrolase/predicted nuclease with RNAse H fold/dephospho-CoA kinase